MSEIVQALLSQVWSSIPGEVMLAGKIIFGLVALSLVLNIILSILKIIDQKKLNAITKIQHEKLIDDFRKLKGRYY